MTSNIEEAMLSSPDPLNDLPTYSSPSKRRSSNGGRRKSVSLGGSSPRKQTFELDVGDKVSPQKIRVTVEADGSDKENGAATRRTRDTTSQSHRAPVIRRNERTTTTTVPLKGLSDSEDDTPDSPIQAPKRGRGRPRKSAGTPVPARRREKTATPNAQPGSRRRTLGDLIDGDDEDDANFTIGAGVEVGRGKGRSRSRSFKENPKKNTPASKAQDSPDRGSSSTARKNSRGRRKTLAPDEVPILDEEIRNVPARTSCGSNDMATAHTNSVVALEDSSRQIPGRLRTASPIHSKGHDTVENQRPFSQARYSPDVEDARSSQNSPAGPHFEDHREEGAEDEVPDLPEFDTILESEGFSMISMDSVPSLRKHLSSPILHDRPASTPTPAFMNKPVEYASNARSAQDPFSSLATPNVLQNRHLSSARAATAAEANDSFSSIPPEILEAATPGRQQLQKNRLLSIRAHDPGHDDSFSSIPSVILDAATPARHRQQMPTANDSRGVDEAAAATSSMLLVPEVTSWKASSQEHSSSRLITPDETPSPDTITGSNSQKSQFESRTNPEEGSSKLMRSSPPPLGNRTYNNSSGLQPNRPMGSNMNKTPSILFSSPSLPPPIQQAMPRKSSPASQTNQENLGLSPIVKAGQALQDITTRSPTSRDRSQSLGSPFKSPITQRRPASSPRGSVAAESSKQGAERAQYLEPRRQDDPFGAFSSATRRELRRNFHAGAKFASVKERVEALNNDDPFSSPESGHQRSPSPEDKNQYSLGIPGQKSSLYPTLNSKEQANTMRSSSAMSWQADNNTLPSPDDTTSVVSAKDAEIEPDMWQSAAEDTQLWDQRREKQWARERAAVSQQVDSASDSQVVVISSDGPDESSVEEEEEEASIAPQGAFDMDEDIWMVEARNSSSLAEEPQSAHGPVEPPVEKPRRSKLPSPWRQNSKRLVYSDELAHSSSSPRVEKEETIVHQPPIVEKRPSPKSIAVEQLPSKVVDSSRISEEPSMLEPIPQKVNFAPRVRPRQSGNLDLSALLGSSPAKRPEALTMEIRQAQQPENRAFNTAMRKPSFTAQTAPAVDGADDESISWDTTDIIEGSMFHQPAPQEVSQSDMSTTSWASTEEQESPSLSPPPKEPLYPVLPQPAPQPTITLSPPKSCLRKSLPDTTSPTKTVVFTGLSSSPSTVTNNSSANNSSSVLQSSSILTPTPARTHALPASHPAPTPLSSTQWSKAHWKLLNRIYQDAKQSPDPPAGSCTSELLGKAVRAQGEKLVLTEWHLDIVACFRDEVPGWEEGVVVRRLFGLVIDEERKARRREEEGEGEAGM